MQIPQLDKFGLLPAGIYDCTLDEIAARFAAGSAEHPRAALREGLEGYVILLKGLGFFKYIFVDGSYVTSKPEPNDVDVLVELPAVSHQISQPVPNTDVVDPAGESCEAIRQRRIAHRRVSSPVPDLGYTGCAHSIAGS
ncbi:MAG TPA: hypothetical protein VIH54_01550 [Chthoniobacterales bacterium]